MDGSSVSAGMQVLGSDGGMIGTVDSVEDDRIKLKRAPEAGGGLHHYIPLAWVARVDDHVHLDRDAALAREVWAAEGADGPRPIQGHEPGTPRWIPWTIGLVGLVIILFLAVRAFQYGVGDQNTERPLPGDGNEVIGSSVGGDDS